MRTFRVEIVTPGAAHDFDRVTALSVPARQGRLAVLPRHQPFICALSEGEAVLTDEEGHEERWRIGDGTLRVSPNGASMLVTSASKRRGQEAPSESP